MKKKMMLHRKKFPVRLTRAGWEYETRESVVRVMVVAEKYAMVRLPGAMPFVVPFSELFDIPQSALIERMNKGIARKVEA